jgi:hypothetical protein
MSSWTPRIIVGASSSERVVTLVMLGGLVAYALIALLTRRWVSGLAAPVVVALLATRHPRARFSAYVFFSAVALRGLVTGGWALLAFGGVAILVLQTGAARLAWPRLVAGRTSTRGPGSST